MQLLILNTCALLRSGFDYDPPKDLLVGNIEMGVIRVILRSCSSIEIVK
jgi:hypothetical protein